MTDGEPELFTLRQPRGWRMAVGVFVAAWSAVLLSIAFSARDDGATRVLPLAMLAVGLVAAVRTLRLAVVARSEELVVRNPWTTRSVPRAEIAGFSTGRHRRIGHRTAYAELRGGDHVRLAALDEPLPFPSREGVIERQLDRLEAWRTAV